MGFEDIIKKIKDDYNAKENNAQNKHEKHINDLKTEHKKILDEMISSAKEKAVIEKKRMYEQHLSIGEANLRRELLGKKQELLDTIFQNAIEKFIQQSKTEYRNKFISLLSKLDHKEGKILVGEEDKDKLDEEFIRLVESETGGNFEFDVTNKAKHGCIFVIGRIRYDFTLDSLFSEIRDDVEEKVINILFN